MFTLCSGHFVKYLSKKRWARFRIVQWSLKSVMLHKMFSYLLRLNCYASDLGFKRCNLYSVISLNGYSLSSLYFNNCENRFKLKWLHDIAHKQYFISNFIIIVVTRERERNVLFNNALNTFYLRYMASDIWLRTILIVRKETRFCHIGYSYRLAARVLLCVLSHRQDNTYHGLCYTCRGALAGSIWRPTAPSLSLSLAKSCLWIHFVLCGFVLLVCINIGRSTNCIPTVSLYPVTGRW